MMNPNEFKEFLEVAVFNKYEVMLIDEEGEAEHFSLENIDKLVDSAFDVEWSAIGVYENGDRIGAFQMITEYNPKKSCACVEIYDYTDIPVIDKIVEQSEKYRT